jgi:hypothetical protein
MLRTDVPAAPRIPLTDDIVVTARRLTRWIQIVAGLQLVGVFSLGFSSVTFLLFTRFSPSTAIVWAVLLLSFAVWTARCAALGKAAQDLDYIRLGSIRAHDRAVRGLWGVANAMMLDAFAIVLTVVAFGIFWSRSAN